MQTNQLVYLVTPLVAGLFGAMSHEYFCDFSSPNNRNRALQLRRSFCSINNIAASGITNADANTDDDNNNNISVINGGHLDSAENRRQVQPDDRKQSIESIASSVLSLGAAGGATLTRPRASEPQSSPLWASVGGDRQLDKLVGVGGDQAGSRASGRPELAAQSSRLVAYKRQQQQQQQQPLKLEPSSNHQRRQSLVRESDFDSNFLISPSPTRIC